MRNVANFNRDRDRNGKLIQQAPKRQWPATLGLARALIAATFAKQNADGGWTPREIRFYMNRMGVRPQSVEALSLDDARKLLIHLARSRMIIFDEATMPEDMRSAVSPETARAAA